MDAKGQQVRSITVLRIVKSFWSPETFINPVSTKVMHCLSRSGCQIKYVFIYLPFQAMLHVRNVNRKYEQTHGDSTH